ncbi:MAG TPA: bis(5'-nucleosyl)-tetraphosphatase (symmetrical) YqeK [Syntrophomonadaceae bacterium]|nr:bis(5'-nucleosyl)-tetraphosphatase (symmetrical) YqeK [Syntrophomonadaceae bacterium]
MLNPKEIKEIIRFKLSKHRFKHSLQVAEAARELADHYDQDGEKAYLIGLLHDYAKGISSQELLELAELHGLLEDEVERRVPDLLHAPVGAWLVREELGIEDEAILHAIKVHTLGDFVMSELDKIIYLADMIEPGRDYAGQERLRGLAFRDLDDAMLFGLESTIRYCLDRNRILHPRTVAVRNHYLQNVLPGRDLG